MPIKAIQLLGIMLTLIYAAFIVWLYSSQPKTLSEISAKATAVVGTYEVDRAKFEEGLRLFRAENYRAARNLFAQADPQKRDAQTQFYIAYSFYREGWGRVYQDDQLFKQGLETVNLATALDPNFKTDDANLKMKTPAELKAEFEQGLEKNLNDLNPLKVLRERK